MPVPRAGSLTRPVVTMLDLGMLDPRMLDLPDARSQKSPQSQRIGRRR
jgi:hypothetical protein